MRSFSVIGTNHTSFTVSDLDRTLGILKDVLGFELLSRGPRDPDVIENVTGVPGADIEVAYLQAPGHRIELIQYLAPADRGKIECRPCDTGFAHLAFDVDDIDAILEATAPVGLKPLGPPLTIAHGPNKGGKVVYTRDPDGITIEFIQLP